jgi:hypothetical protein
MTLPKIGQRNIKTAIAVLLSLLVKIILMLAIDLPTGQPWSKIVYTPFFGGIAAAYSMHMDKQASIKQAKTRTMGSLVGGVYGMLVLMFSYAILVQLCGLDTSSITYYLLDYLIVAVAIIFMIHLTVITKKTYSTWIACLTYLSVTVSIRNDFDAQLAGFFTSNEHLNSYLIAIVFALNRIFSTVVGVLISLGVNLFRVPKHKNKNVLFVSSLDKAILNSNHQISGFTKYKINHLVQSGCNITFATTRTQSSLNQIFDGISLKMPLITMNGSAIYNPKNKHYTSVDFIDQDVRFRLDLLFNAMDVNYFCYTVEDDILQIYHGKLKHDAEKKYYLDRRNEYFDNYVRGTVPDDMFACFYVLINKKDVIMQLVSQINSTDYADRLDLLYYEYDIEGYYFLKINSRSSNKYTRLAELKEQIGAKNLVVFGSGSSDIDMMKMADISLCLKTAPEIIKSQATKVLDTDDPDVILKTIEKIYHKKDFQSYKQKLTPTNK